MLVTICEHLADVASEIDVAHGQIVFSLDPADARRSHLGHAVVRVAAPVARIDGIALIVGDEASAPDPLQIRVRSDRGRGPRGGVGGLEVRRTALPLLLVVDPLAHRASVLRRLARPKGPAAGTADEPPVPTLRDDSPGTSDPLADQVEE